MSRTEPDALDVLAASRERLRSAMVRRRAQPKTARAPRQGAAGDAAPSDEADERPHRDGAIWRYWRRKVNDSPVLTLLVESAQSWWQMHPWRQLGQSFLSPLSEVATPIVRRHPWPAVAVAAAVGAGVVAARPWRWGFVSRQMRPMPSRAMHWLWAQATSPTGQVVLASLLAGLVAPAAQAAADAMTGADDKTDKDTAGPFPASAPAPSPTAASASPVPTAAPRPQQAAATTE